MKRPCCRPAAAHDWQPLSGRPGFFVCAKCDRLANGQGGGFARNRGRLRLYNYPEMEKMIRERAADAIEGASCKTAS
jgi:hypothetical protein